MKKSEFIILVLVTNSLFSKGIVTSTNQIKRSMLLKADGFLGQLVYLSFHFYHLDYFF